MNFNIMRSIEIDAAHRVPEHGSGCRNLHGHRYKIEAYCKGELATEGEQQGMALDFKFLKEEMMRHIHDPCDHGMMLRYNDPLLELLAPNIAAMAEVVAMKDVYHDGMFLADNSMWNKGLKLYILPMVPTAENLAKHFYCKLFEHIKHRSDDRAKLARIRVWETPNCFAEYPAGIV